MNIFENLLAYDFERNQICDVLGIVTSNLNDRKYGKVELNNGISTYYKNFLLKECVILQWTGQLDCDKQKIYQDDLVENDKYIYRVEWNQNQTCWWLHPLVDKSKVEIDVKDFFMLTIGNEQLGDGYFKR